MAQRKKTKREDNVFYLATSWGDTFAEAVRATAHLSDAELEAWVNEQNCDDFTNGW